ncbi:cell division protein FtsL [Clostridium botulinum]|uniref:Cell division protein FtsL n=1 Tax=Clostridium botulinum TaxID=1491 RepID=A0A846JAM4_CLOBO|nr:cell division protein FtsL [Clostridium botulinum]ACA53764.1 cell division protein FtsL homolog [Clostridium botulinum A3 str. Loch Maree]NFH67168.1 cell division protein FtsL [Clostridium botulinum]NFJ10652.1 cell division protein FtsL [Clostridium botulinum]NFK15494.1 cell division protein FtsL [Clostridium botulinum]NFM95585.1 cell division protein FtsL [Clostridium botulinum]
MVMLEAKNRFNGNTVLKPQYEPQIEKDKVKDKKEQYKRNKKIQQKLLKKKFKTLRNIIIAFIIGVTLVARYGILYSIQKDLSNINSHISEVEKENENLKVELVHYNNLSNIEKVAGQNLKMVPPDKDSAIYTDLSYNNFKTENSKNHIGEKHNAFLEFFSNLKKVLF